MHYHPPRLPCSIFTTCNAYPRVQNREETMLSRSMRIHNEAVNIYVHDHIDARVLQLTTV